MFVVYGWLSETGSNLSVSRPVNRQAVSDSAIQQDVIWQLKETKWVQSSNWSEFQLHVPSEWRCSQKAETVWFHLRGALKRPKPRQWGPSQWLPRLGGGVGQKRGNERRAKGGFAVPELLCIMNVAVFIHTHGVYVHGSVCQEQPILLLDNLSNKHFEMYWSGFLRPWFPIPRN